MKRFLTAVYKVDISFQAVAGTGLVFMMAIGKIVMFFMCRSI